MRKIIIILITSILALEIASCASVGRKTFREVGEVAARKVFQEVEEVAARKASQEAEEAAARKAFQKTADEVATRKAFQEVQHLKEKIYDTAYTEALRYYELEGNQASQVIANKIAVKAASEKNRELGDVLGDVAVTTIAGSAATAAAATYYQANNQG